MKIRHLTLLLTMVLWFAATLPVHADAVAEHGEWMAKNSSARETLVVTFEWTDLTFNRVHRATLTVPPRGEVRICPVQGNSQPVEVQKR